MADDAKTKKFTIPKNTERCFHITEKGERCKNKKESEDSEHCHIHAINPKKVLSVKPKKAVSKK